MSEEHSSRHQNALRNGSATLLKSKDLLFLMNEKQIHHLVDKVMRHKEENNNGFPDPALTCWCLPPLGEAKATVAYKRVHAGVKRRRGAYLKASYSFSGQYAQTTFTRKENKALGFPDELFPTTRTFQATHLVLVSEDRRPPLEDWQMYNASHLCGRSNCIRPSHLIWERLDLNYARRMCHVYGAFEECPHEPKCILRAPYKHFLSDATKGAEETPIP